MSRPLRPTDHPKRAFRTTLLVAVLALAIPWLATFTSALLAVADTARSGVASRVEAVGNSLIGDIASYLALGIPFERMVGVSEYFGDYLQDHEDVQAAILTAEGGQVIGQFVREGDAELAVRAVSGSRDWTRFGLRTRVLPVVRDGVLIGNLTLAYRTGAAGPVSAWTAASFVILLLVLLVVVYEVLLVTYREAVWAPLQKVVALEQLAAQRSFAQLASIAAGGPLAGLVEAVNQMVIAVNDRYARVRDHLAEIRSLSFNPQAPEKVAELERRLAALGQLAPEGMTEVEIDSGDLFAGPIAFRAGAFLGLVCAVAAVAGSPGSVSTSLAAGLLGLPLALLPFAGRLRRRILAGAAVAAIAFLLLPLVKETVLSPLAVAVASAGAWTVALTVRGGRGMASVAPLAHGATGFAAGGAIGALVGGGSAWGSHAAGALALASVVLVATRHARDRESRRSLIAIIETQLKDMAANIPAVVFWAAAGYWVVLAYPARTTEGIEAVRMIGLTSWWLGFIIAAGVGAALPALRRYGRVAATGGLALSALWVGMVCLLGQPFVGLGAVLAGFAIGIGAACAAAVSLDSSSGLQAPSLVGLVCGVVAALACDWGAITGAAPLALLVVAVVVAALAVWRGWYGGMIDAVRKGWR